MPDGVMREGTLIEICLAVHGSIGTICLGATKTLVAVPAAIMLVAPTHAVALFEMRHVRARRFDDADTFVAKNHVDVAVVQV